ncbi:putative transcription factor C2H2 family [Helianthus annuus]|nr:putative transcription factor C2H2 family [Helianthus annuus]KAJ0761657.1 putative transcription factor C2H2 family [Helianthus annuus]
MDVSYVHKHVYTSIHRSITNHQNSTYKPSAATNAAGFPLLAIVIACITAITFLIVSYFLITKCCYPLARFLMTRTPSSDEPPSIYSTPAWQITGLDESLIQQIPVCRYSKRDGDNIRLYKCVVCLNEFQDSDTLRVLPSCDHGFHLHCIDIWLRSNPNCPICRLNISGGAPNPTDTIVMTSSPQHPPSLAHNSPTTSDEEFVTIELGDYSRESQKCRVDPIVSDKRVCVAKDEELVIQPLRRSFSMDSAADCHVYLSVQDIIRNHEEANRTKRPFFSFGHTRGSRSAILPLEL